MKYKIMALTLLTAGVAFSQTTNNLLSWEDCLEQTRLNNPDLVSARSAVRELEYGVASVSSVFLPQISASAGASYSGAENTADWVDSKSASGRLSLSQDLFSGGGNIAKRKRALAQLTVGGEQYRSTLSDVELRSRLAYIEALYAQELIDLTEDIEKRRGNNVRLIQLRFDGGRENAGSLARSKAQLSQAQYESREAKRSLVYALRNLSAAMGGMTLAEGVAGEMTALAPDELVDLEALMKQTPDYGIATTQIEASELGLKVTRSSRFPSVSFSASTGLNSGDLGLYRGSWSMGLNASMQLYTGNRLSSEVAAAKENIIQSEMSLMDLANTLMASLQQRWNTYANAVESEAVQNELLAAEILRAEISTAKYKQGLLSYEDWDIIESNLISQGKTHLQRRRTAEQEMARWKNALGWSVWPTTEEGE